MVQTDRPTFFTMVGQTKAHRQRQRERHREREREREIQTDRQTDRQAERERVKDGKHTDTDGQVCKKQHSGKSDATTSLYHCLRCY